MIGTAIIVIFLLGLVFWVIGREKERKQRQSLQMQLAYAIEALAFYADKGSYPTIVEEDEGETARKALDIN